MKFVIDVPDNLFPALVEIAHTARKPAEQFIEDFLTESIRQRMYHLRDNDQTEPDGACGFRPSMMRGDRPALSLELFAQAETAKRRCPDCVEVMEERRTKVYAPLR